MRCLVGAFRCYRCEQDRISSPRALASVSAGEAPGQEASALKVLATENQQHIDELFVEAAAFHAQRKFDDSVTPDWASNYSIPSFASIPQSKLEDLKDALYRKLDLTLAHRLSRSGLGRMTVIPMNVCVPRCMWMVFGWMRLK